MDYLIKNNIFSIKNNNLHGKNNRLPIIFNRFLKGFLYVSHFNLEEQDHVPDCRRQRHFEPHRRQA